ncbi:hypothetical protein [Alcanivorax sp. 1008]|uniref:hypothetical protein n=1 Tax=Alcanivorax sp. 1008 TaxID=2816853 RepID=UPI001D23F04D|nr:hypothetical protein [Alcanivorax sp. 1008]MCC1496315.1 hypothetical protein [Alcanivorax sp. 1008]
MNFEVLLSSAYGAAYGAAFAVILVPLYSWALRQRENVRILTTTFVACLGPAFMIANKKTTEFLMIPENEDWSGISFALLGVMIFIFYGIKLKIFSRKPRRD